MLFADSKICVIILWNSMAQWLRQRIRTHTKTFRN